MLPTAARPPCFDSDRQYAAWRDAARHAGSPPDGHCADCTPEYQQRMIRQRRCEQPRARFVPGCDGAVEGRLPWPAARRPRRTR